MLKTISVNDEYIFSCHQNKIWKLSKLVDWTNFTNCLSFVHKYFQVYQRCTPSPGFATPTPFAVKGLVFTQRIAPGTMQRGKFGRNADEDHCFLLQYFYNHLFLKYLGGTILEYNLQKQLCETIIEFSGSVMVLSMLVFFGKANLRWHFSGRFRFKGLFVFGYTLSS